MTDWRDKLKAARLPERTVPIVLRGDLAAEHERITRELEQAKARKADSLAGSGTGELEEQLHRVEDEMRDSVVEFRLRALPRAKRPGDNRPSWRELKEQHPPREKDGMMLTEDRVAGGMNIETVAEPLVRVSIVEPGDITDADWANLMATLTDRQFDDLVQAAWQLNQDSVDLPF